MTLDELGVPASHADVVVAQVNLYLQGIRGVTYGAEKEFRTATTTPDFEEYESSRIVRVIPPSVFEIRKVLTEEGRVYFGCSNQSSMHFLVSYDTIQSHAKAVNPDNDMGEFIQYVTDKVIEEYGLNSIDVSDYDDEDIGRF